jgi:hypothetical protein
VLDRVLYTPARLAIIASEAAKPDSIFSLGDRMGLVHDAFALGKAGYLSLSSALNLVYELRAENECEILVPSSRYRTKANAWIESLGLGQHGCKLGWGYPDVVGG